MTDGMTIHLRIWRQGRDEAKGRFEQHTVTDVLPEMSFLECSTS